MNVFAAWRKGTAPLGGREEEEEGEKEEEDDEEGEEEEEEEDGEEEEALYLFQHDHLSFEVRHHLAFIHQSRFRPFHCLPSFR